MALDMRPLHSSFGVEIAGIDVRRIDDAVFREVARALDDHSVLLFRGQSLTDAEQIAFSERFGPLETTIRTIASQARDLPEISNLSNVDTEDRLIPRGDKRNLFNAGNQMWHSDSSFKRVPAMASLLSAREVPPEGGETQFASMRVGYEGLSEAMKQQIEGRVAIHSFVYSRGLVGDELLPPDHAAQVPPVPQALVRANPSNGRKAYYVGSHACEIVGMPTGEARALLRELVVAATRPELIYTHRWAPGDLVMWDNRAVTPPRPTMGREPVPPRDAPDDGGRHRAHRGGRPGRHGLGSPRARCRLGPRSARSRLSAATERIRLTTPETSRARILRQTDPSFRSRTAAHLPDPEGSRRSLTSGASGPRRVRSRGDRR